MNITQDDSLEHIYEQRVLPAFEPIYGHIQWHGHSILGDDSSVHYFSANDESYLLLFESSVNTALHLLADNSISPHQSLELIQPKDSDYPNVYIQDNDTYIPNVTGYFSLFKISE